MVTTLSEMGGAETLAPTERWWQRVGYGPALALGLLAVSVFACAMSWRQPVGRPFVDDDWIYLNIAQQHALGGHQAWSLSAVLFRPLLYVFFGLLHSLFGTDSLPYHLLAAVITFVEGALAATIGLAAGLRRGAVVVAAVVWLHTVAAQPISWSSAVSSPLSVSLALAAIATLVVRGGARRSTEPLAALLLVCGLLTREVVIVAPIGLMAVSWASPAGTLRKAARLSVPLWLADAVYLVTRGLGGAGDPSGFYHQSITSKAFHNTWQLLLLLGDLSGQQTEVLGVAALAAVGVGGLILSPRRRTIAAGLIWMFAGLLPVAFLVLHPMDPYYPDMALPGLALVAGGAVDALLGRLPAVPAMITTTAAIAVLALVGTSVANHQYRRQLGADTTVTASVLAQVRSQYPVVRGPMTIIVHDPAMAADPDYVTREGDLFRVEFDDPQLKVKFVR